MVTIRNGRMLIALPNDVLFDSGKTALKAEGKEAIGKIAQVLATIGDRRFLVGGHTDNVPIKNAKFPSNWELASARAKGPQVTASHTSHAHIGHFGRSRQTVMPYPHSEQRYSPLTWSPAAAPSCTPYVCCPSPRRGPATCRGTRTPHAGTDPRRRS